VIVLLGVVESGTEPFVWLENMRVGADIFQKIATAVALVIGGIFAWYKFIRRGELDPRLQPTVIGKAAISDGTIYVVATVTILNTGVVEVGLSGGTAVLELYATKPEDDAFEYVDIAPVSVFEDHNHVQPGETLEDQVWFQLPHEGQVGIRLDLTVVIVDDSVSPPEEISYPTTNIVGLITQEGRPFTEDG
jgi:hypothetical protein